MQKKDKFWPRVRISCVQIRRRKRRAERPWWILPCPSSRVRRRWAASACPPASRSTRNRTRPTPGRCRKGAERAARGARWVRTCCRWKRRTGWSRRPPAMSQLRLLLRLRLPTDCIRTMKSFSSKLRPHLLANSMSTSSSADSIKFTH